jgi:hypothetical protein
MRWLKSLVGLRKVERRQQQRRKEDGDAGRIVGASTSTYLRFQVFFFLISDSFWSLNWWVRSSDFALVGITDWKNHIRVKSSNIFPIAA